MTKIYHYFLLFAYGIYHLFLYCILAAPAKDIMSSVCGSNGIKYKFFTNEEVIKEKNKFLQVDWTAFKLAPLSCCLLQYRHTTGCSSQNMTICAIDIATNVTRVFNNSCIMEKTACKLNIDWRFVKTGLCNEIGLDPVPCTKFYKPVCAIFAGVKSTFSSECLVNSENMSTGSDWRIYSEKICTEDIMHYFPSVTR